MTHRVQAGAVRVAYERQGQGPPLLLMHGAEASRLMFSALMPLLARHFTVFACDQRDCGDTEGPQTHSTLADLADDARQFMEALGLGRAHVFGSSFGGRVAQALALRHPGCVDRLVLGSTWPLPDTYEAVCPDAPRLAALRLRLPATAEELAGWFFPEAFLQQRPELRGVFASARPETLRSARRAATVQTTLSQDCAAIAAPTLLLAGELDRVVPPGVTLSMASRIAGAQTAVLTGAGHATALQVPELLAHHIARFLTGGSLLKE
jgi:pimeloyl-ACP methyl ester carboxylesterase